MLPVNKFIHLGKLHRKFRFEIHVNVEAITSYYIKLFHCYFCRINFEKRARNIPFKLQKICWTGTYNINEQLRNFN